MKGYSNSFIYWLALVAVIFVFWLHKNITSSTITYKPIEEETSDSVYLCLDGWKRSRSLSFKKIEGCPDQVVSDDMRMSWVTITDQRIK